MQTFTRLRTTDWMAILLILTAGMAIADWRAHQSPRSSGLWLKPDARDHLGAEYDSIAQAIRHGRGFSDPFREPTGPTAWMPPVIPHFLALLYWLLSDDRGSVVTVVVCLQTLIVGMTLAIVVSEARRHLAARLGYAIVLVGLTVNFHELFQKTHDVWLNLFIVNLLWIGASYRWHRPRRVVYWGVLGGLSALCSPILGAAWATITAWRWLVVGFRHSNRAVRRRAICCTAAVACLSVAIVLPWTLRNLVVLERLVPIKSNGMFELWQSQCLDDDGVLDWKTTAEHPWPSDGHLRREYRSLGEMAFMAHYAEEVLASIHGDPLGFVDRVCARFLAATLWYQSHDHFDERMFWPLLFKRVVFPLPFLAAILWLSCGSLGDRRAAAALAVYCVALSPYVLVSYYERYAMPLIGIQMLLVLYAVSHSGKPSGNVLSVARKTTARSCYGKHHVFFTCVASSRRSCTWESSWRSTKNGCSGPAGGGA